MDFSSKVPRGALDQHLKEYTELHLEMACEKLREFRDLLEGNVREIQASVEEADRRISDLHGTIRQRNMELEELFQNRVGLLDKDVNDLKHKVSVFFLVILVFFSVIVIIVLSYYLATPRTK